MARISTHKYNLHEKAVSLLAKTALTLDEKHFVLEHFHEAANNNNGKAGAFFTPLSLAQEFVVHAPTPCKKGAVRILDLCAGIGALSFCMARAYEWSASESCELVCVELNPDYVAVGKKVVPEATWVQGDINDIDLLLSLGKFDFAISNPPFGAVATFSNREKLSYTGAMAEYKVIELASLVADLGAFILPQRSCDFKYSGVPHFERVRCEALATFTAQTGITLENTNLGETQEFQHDWKSAVPVVEMVQTDFSTATTSRQPHTGPIKAEVAQMLELF